MKRILFSLFVVLVSITTSCDKDHEGPISIVMTTQKTNIEIGIAGSGTITIDWRE